MNRCNIQGICWNCYHKREQAMAERQSTLLRTCIQNITCTAHKWAKAILKLQTLYIVFEDRSCPGFEGVPSFLLLCDLIGMEYTVRKQNHVNSFRGHPSIRRNDGEKPLTRGWHHKCRHRMWSLEVCLVSYPCQRKVYWTYSRHPGDPGPWARTHHCRPGSTQVIPTNTIQPT